MQKKNKYKIFNILIIIISLIVFLQSGMVLISGLKSQTPPCLIEVKSFGDIDILQKEGLLDLVNTTTDLTPVELIQITSKDDFCSLFNSYFDKLKNTGGYYLKGDFIVTGTADVFGGITAYQATSSYYEIDHNGNLYSESITCEIPSPSGKTTGYGDTIGKKEWNDGKTLKSQYTNNVAYSVIDDRNVLKANYDGVEIEEKVSDKAIYALPFVVDTNTISDFVFIENTLTYNIRILLNQNGYLQIAKDSQEKAHAVELPQYNTFELNITMDKWGNVITIQCYEDYNIIVKRAGMNISSQTQSIINYIIGKLKKNDD